MCLLNLRYSGADPGGGGPGGQGPPPFGAPPNFIKREKTSKKLKHAKTPHFST